MPAQSLKRLATQQMIKNIHLLYDVGDIPFYFLEPVLRCIENPDQLRDLEENCPQLKGETADIWLRMIQRDIPNWETRRYKPANPESWSKAYRKLKKDSEDEKKAQEDALKQQMKAIQKDRESTKTMIFDSKVGYGARSNIIHNGGTSRGWGLVGAPAKTGKVVMDKLKRGMFDYKRERPNTAKMPSHLLAQRRFNQVQTVPERLVRIAQNERPQQMVVSKQAAASVSRKANPTPFMDKPNITRRPVIQARTASPAPSLPRDQQFTVPKRKAPESGAAGTAAPAKRFRREEASLFHKRPRKV